MQRNEKWPKLGHSLTYEGVKDRGDGTGHHHAQDSFGSVSLAVHKHQAHIFKVAHGACEELHQGVGQPVAGQHLHRILLDSRDAPVQGLRGERQPTNSIRKPFSSPGNHTSKTKLNDHVSMETLSSL